MSIKTRLEKLEEKQSPELLNIVLRVPYSKTPLPEPHISGTVLVSYRYADDIEDLN